VIRDNGSGSTFLPVSVYTGFIGVLGTFSPSSRKAILIVVPAGHILDALNAADNFCMCMSEDPLSRFWFIASCSCFGVCCIHILVCVIGVSSGIFIISIKIKKHVINKEMSAGGLSYSGIVGFGKATLQSVDSWGTNNNILRDPPKSITTRRIDKVGETSSITEMIDEAGDRGCEAIQVYARGVNPSVSVSYSNHGNNGGQRSGGIIAGGQQAAKLPYTIMKDGAFRPPVRMQEELLPLSRQPRAWTSAKTNAEFIDYSRKARVCATADKTKEVKTDILHTVVRPTAVYKVEKPAEKPFEVKYVIQPSIKTSATSGVRSMDVTQRVVQEPTKEIYIDPMHAMARSNAGDSRRFVGNNNDLDTERFVQNVNTSNVLTNPGSKVSNTSSIEDVLDLSDIRVRDLRNVSHHAAVSGVEKNNYIHDDMELSRVLPNHHATTNVGDRSVHKRVAHENELYFERNMPKASFSSNIVAKGDDSHSSRDYSLAPKLQPGGFNNSGQIASHQRADLIRGPYESEKSVMSRKMNLEMAGRYGRPMV